MAEAVEAGAVLDGDEDTDQDSAPEETVDDEDSEAVSDYLWPAYPETHWLATKMKATTFSYVWHIQHFAARQMKGNVFESPPFYGHGNNPSFVLQLQHRDSRWKDLNVFELALKMMTKVESPFGQAQPVLQQVQPPTQQSALFAFGSGQKLQPVRKATLRVSSMAHAVSVRPSSGPGIKFSLAAAVTTYPTPILAQFRACIINSDGEKTHLVEERKFGIFENDTVRYVHCNFVRRDELFDKSRGLLTDNTLTIMCAVSIIADNAIFAGDQVKPPPIPLAAVNEGKCPVARHFNSALEEGLFSDVTLSVGGTDFKAHRTILALQSTVFRAMFERDMKEKEEQRVVIEDFPAEVVAEMLSYLYNGNAPNVKRLSSELFSIADKYNVSGLKAVCEETLARALTWDNSVSVWRLAHFHNSDVLKKSALYSITRNINDVMATEDWKSMARSHHELVNETLEEMAEMFRQLSSAIPEQRRTAVRETLSTEQKLS